MMTTFEKIIKNLNRIERELVKPEAERRDSLPIYDDTYQRNSLMAVHFYNIDYGSGKRKQIIKVYTSDTIYTYEDYNLETKGTCLKEHEEHFFKGVPVNEYANNEERTGAYESVLDNIDA
ncbi:TPA: phage portal protein [Streptococcus pyogenes]|nr:phage portal protein [Streptococcus pyogenes]HER3521335.1 phage portal protein [Streptococcus pyogenes]